MIAIESEGLDRTVTLELIGRKGYRYQVAIPLGEWRRIDAFVRAVDEAGRPKGGSFTVTHKGRTSRDLPHDASPTAIAEEIERLDHQAARPPFDTPFDTEEGERRAPRPPRCAAENSEKAADNS